MSTEEQDDQVVGIAADVPMSCATSHADASCAALPSIRSNM